MMDKSGLSIIEKHTKEETRAYIDTADNIFFKNSFLYVKRNDKTILCDVLSIRQDTVKYCYWSQDNYLLSDSLLLKSANQYYFFNLRESTSYWIVFLMQKVESSIIFKYLNQDDFDYLKNQGFVTIDSLKEIKFGGKDYYCQSSLTKNNLIKFIEGGGFSDTLMILDNEKRVFKDQ